MAGLRRRRASFRRGSLSIVRPRFFLGLGFEVGLVASWLGVGYSVIYPFVVVRWRGLGQLDLTVSPTPASLHSAADSVELAFGESAVPVWSGALAMPVERRRRRLPWKPRWPRVGASWPPTVCRRPRQNAQGWDASTHGPSCSSVFDLAREGWTSVPRELTTRTKVRLF